MLEKLRELNLKLIDSYQNNEEKLKKQLIIQKMLSFKNCFLQMDIETAYSVLKDLTLPKESIKEVYKELIDIKNYEN